MEKKTSRFYYKSENKFLSKSNLATLFQSALNTAAGEALFNVYTDSKTEPKNSNTPYVCVLKTKITPTALKGIYGATYNIRLICKIPVDKNDEKNTAINALEKVIQLEGGEFYPTEEMVTVKYKYRCAFTLNEPSTPELINSVSVSNYVIEGPITLVLDEGGGILSDTIKTYIVINGVDYEVVFQAFSANGTASTDSPIKAGSFQPDTEYNALLWGVGATLIYRNDYICNLLRDYAKGNIDLSDSVFIRGSDGKPIIKIKELYPDKEITTDYCINDCVETRQAGVYAALNLTLIKTKDKSKEKRLFGRKITFTVADNEYTALESWTWEDWINSEYNVDDFYVGNNDNIYFALDGAIYMAGGYGYDVSPTSKIIENSIYGYAYVGNE